MSDGLTLKTWACLGDSMTQNNPSQLPGTTQPWVSRLDVALFPGRSAANMGQNSYVMTQIRTRYDDRVKGKGFYGIVLWGGINDIIGSATGVYVFDAVQSLVDDALSRGMKVITIITPPFKNYGSWSLAKQTELEAFRTLMLATFVDGYHENFVAQLDFYTLAASSTEPRALAAAYEQAIPDGLHQGLGMQNEVILPNLIPLMEAPASEADSDHAPDAAPSPDLRMKRGDLAPAFERQLLDERGAPLDLSGENVDVVFRMRGADSGALIVDDAAAIIVNARKGRVRYEWQSGDTDVAGLFDAEFVVSTGPRTLPASRYYSIEIFNLVTD